MAATFKQKTVQQILQQFFKDEKTKITAEALQLFTELITIFVAEAVGRTTKQAKNDGDDELTLEQFEKILPQLVSVGFVTTGVTLTMSTEDFEQLRRELLDVI